MTPKKLEAQDCITVKQLKEWVKDLPEENALGEPTEVWIGTKGGESNECRAIWPLNLRDRGTPEESCDIILEIE